MKTSYAALFNANCRVGYPPDEIKFPKNSISFLPSAIAREMAEKNLAKIYNANDLFTRFDVNRNHTPRILFAHLGGGIGDVLAFSALASYLKQYPLIVHTDPKYFPIVRMFDRDNITLKHMYAPVVTNVTGMNFDLLSRLAIEFAAVDGGSKNWYDALFSRIGLNEAPPGYRSPRLKAVNAPTLEKTALICHKSSCQMRTSSFEDFYWPVKKALPGWKIMIFWNDVHPEFNTMEHEGDVRIIPTTNIQQYLNIMGQMSLVITTDTAAIHYREAIGKPALGVYGAFTTDSRTKYYTHTRSFNVKSGCKYQPCFVHELTKGQICPLVTDAMKEAKGETVKFDTAPCQSGEGFREQLYNEILSYVKDIGNG